MMWKLPGLRIQTVCILLICSFSVQVAAMPDEDVGAEKNRPKIGLVLSGGGARGAAHVGVLKVLEQNHIPVDYIAGTSFGAIVGGLYASGYSAVELEEVLANIDWKESLSGRAPREERSFRRKQDDNGFLIKFKIGIKDGKLKLPSGLITPNNLRLTLQDLINEEANVDDFDDLKIPFRAVATDLESGDAVVLGRGDLASAIVASMAVPALFPPVNFEGQLLVDGGVSNNVPVNVAREMGADIVIVVDISTPMMKKDDIGSLTKVVDQLILIMTNQNTAAQLASLSENDILIRPDLDDIGFADFERALEVIPRGEDAAQRVLTRLQEHSLSQQDWLAFTDTQAPGQREQPVVDFIRIVNDANVSDEVIMARLSQVKGEAIDVERL